MFTAILHTIALVLSDAWLRDNAETISRLKIAAERAESGGGLR